MPIIDLHTHSTASDGTLTPTELIRLAKERDIAALALTDHDTVSGLGEAFAAGEQYGVEVIGGCELSVSSDHGFMHIVGLFLPERPERLVEKITTLTEHRQNRNTLILEKLRSGGVAITDEELRAKAGNGSIGRPHIAQLLLEKGHVPTIQAAFTDYLGDKGRAYVPKAKLTPEEAIALLKSEGATVILAHPFTLRLAYEDLYHCLKGLKAMGLDGLECHYTEHSNRLTKEYEGLAYRLDLAVSGGSDFHGSVKPEVQLGTGKGNLAIPVSVLDAIKQRRIKQGLPA
ncbi:PHP domain-containing protein [Desulfobaculum sp. SPO524]|uniref:PHP domain-containing protein n=1 Tax=Desulfobaculum sp. SPO524 TaxID=3378071 RepID=UPI00385274F5